MRLVCLVTLCCVTCAFADDSEQANAALALAKAKREREAASVLASADMKCHTDYATGAEAAQKAGKALVIWVNVTCKDHPDLRKALKAAEHCHVTKWRKSDEPRIVIQGGDGQEYYILPANIKPDAAAKIEAKWNLPYIPPVRGDVIISEEFSYLPRRQPMWQPRFPTYYEPQQFMRQTAGVCTTG